jgi:hypothetical protein
MIDREIIRADGEQDRCSTQEQRRPEFCGQAGPKMAVADERLCDRSGWEHKSKTASPRRTARRRPDCGRPHWPPFSRFRNPCGRATSRSRARRGGSPRRDAVRNAANASSTITGMFMACSSPLRSSKRLSIQRVAAVRCMASHNHSACDRRPFEPNIL